MNMHFKNMAERRASREGFTLGELLIAVAIIGILAAISMPIFFGYIQKSRETVCLSNRTDARRMLLSEQILSQEATLQEVSETDAGKEIMSQFRCPSGGQIYVDGNDVKCTVHDDSKDTEKPTTEEDPFAKLSVSEKAGTFIDLASKLGDLSDEILGNGDGSINRIKDNIEQMNTTIQNKKQGISQDTLAQINRLADEINEIAVGLDGIPKSVQGKVDQLGTSIQYESLEAVGTYQGIINGYVKAGATQAAGEEAADAEYPGMRSTLNANLPTLSEVNDQLTDCRERIAAINQRLSEINELLKDN